MALDGPAFLLILPALVSVWTLVSLNSSGGIRECRKTLAMPVLEVLPGGGWDNLRNLDMGRVMDVSYALCHTTEDGAYLIPDEVFVVPRKVSNVETHSELIESWLQQSSSVACSINADVSFLGVLNGKFSAESQRMKTHQVRESSVTTRVQVRGRGGAEEVTRQVFYKGSPKRR